MRRITLLVLAAAWTIAPAWSAAVATGPLSPLPANPRYFTDGSGKAIYLTGSHNWANFATDQGSAPFDYEKFLDFLTAHNHNFFRGWVWDLPYSVQGHNGGPFYWHPFQWQRTGPGEAADGKPKFDLDKFDQGYFDRIRSRIIAARNRGIYVSVMLFQAYAIQFDRNEKDGFPLDGRNNINGVDAGKGHAANTLEIPAVVAREEAYVRKVIDTVNDLDNVLYEIANEAGSYATPWQYHMIDFIHRYEKTKPKQHPVGMTFQYRGGTNQELFDSPADWISPDGSQGYQQDPPDAAGRKVVVVDTDHAYGWQPLKKVGPKGHQAFVWKNLLRGNQTLFMDPYLAKITINNVVRNSPGGTNPKEPYFGLSPDPYWETLRISMGRARMYAQKIDLASATPHSDLSSTGYCLANSGKEYLVYNPGDSKSFNVTLTGGVYGFEWFNPTTGKVAGRGKFTASEGSRPFSAPFEGDSVLYLKKRK